MVLLTSYYHKSQTEFWQSYADQNNKNTLYHFIWSPSGGINVDEVLVLPAFLYGDPGALPWKIFKTNNAGEAI